MHSVLRIIDANLNRAREALRVMEEAARFLLDDAALSESIKILRHDLSKIAASLPALEYHRDTPGDVGTNIKTATELHRESVADVAIAAGKRLSEALRAIEEYSKTLDEKITGTNTPISVAVEAMRYRGYDIELRLTRALGCGRAKQWRLCVLLSESLCPGGDWLAVARAAIEGGADCLQLREKAIDAGELLNRSRVLVSLCQGKNVAVIINDRPDVALLAGADGVHLGQGDLPCAEARKLVGRQLIIGVSTSNLDDAKRAQRDGADYCGVGPMFATTTKHKDHIVGPGYLREYVATIKLPHLAIGGISTASLPALIAAGVRGVAVSSAVCGAPDPRAVVAELLKQLPANG
jgi:thiamine-phosphate pyrophosphorylase